jgi:hypothetical protein
MYIVALHVWVGGSRHILWHVGFRGNVHQRWLDGVFVVDIMGCLFFPLSWCTYDDDVSGGSFRSVVLFRNPLPPDPLSVLFPVTMTHFEEGVGDLL